MMLGKPVVGVEIGMIPELIGNAGMCVRPHHVEIVRSLLELISKPEVKQELSEQARKRAAEIFSLEKEARTTFEIYKKIAQSFS